MNNENSEKQADGLTLQVNGETKTYAARSLSALLEELGLASAQIVAEVNGEIVPRERFAAAGLNEGDRVELVRFVGGG